MAILAHALAARTAPTAIRAHLIAPAWRAMPRSDEARTRGVAAHHVDYQYILAHCVATCRW